MACQHNRLMAGLTLEVSKGTYTVDILLIIRSHVLCSHVGKDMVYIIELSCNYCPV